MCFVQQNLSLFHIWISAFRQRVLLSTSFSLLLLANCLLASPSPPPNLSREIPPHRGRFRHLHAVPGRQIRIVDRLAVQVHRPEQNLYRHVDEVLRGQRRHGPFPLTATQQKPANNRIVEGPRGAKQPPKTFSGSPYWRTGKLTAAASDPRNLRPEWARRFCGRPPTGTTLPRGTRISGGWSPFLESLRTQITSCFKLYQRQRSYTVQKFASQSMVRTTATAS